MIYLNSLKMLQYIFKSINLERFHFYIFDSQPKLKEIISLVDLLIRSYIITLVYSISRWLISKKTLVETTVPKMHYIQNILQRHHRMESQIGSKHPSWFQSETKWSSSSHFHFLVLVLLGTMILFLKCNKETNMLQLKQSSFTLEVDWIGEQMDMDDR